MAQALKIRLPDGRTLVPSDWTASPLFSTVEIDDASNLSPLPGFSYGAGGDVPGSVGPRKATAADTNMQGQGGILAENEELLLYALQIELFQIYSNGENFFTGQELFAPNPPHVSLTNVLKVQRSTSVRLKIANTKDYCFAPIGFFPAAMGTHAGFGAARSGRAVSATFPYPVAVGSNGNVSSGDQREFATPHHVAGGEAFAVNLEFPYGGVTEPLGISNSGLNFGSDTGARIRARIYAVGLRRRPVA